MPEHPTKLSAAARELGLEPYILDLEVNGLTILPPEVHGVAEDRFDQMLGSDARSAWSVARMRNSTSRRTPGA